MDTTKPMNSVAINMAYRQYKARQVTFYIAAVTAFLMSSYFMVNYFAGNLQITTWNLEQWKQAIASLGISFVMTAFQFVLYSEGQHKRATALTVLATLVAVFFAFLTEIGQGMEREEQRVSMRSLESPTYQVMLERISQLGDVPLAAHPYADEIANAQMKLARCEARLARGLEQHCQQSTARLAAYEQQAAAYVSQLQQQQTNTATALFQQAKAMEKDASNHHPLVKLLISWFGIASVSGNFLISLLIIAAFEFAFHYLGGKYAASREVLLQAGVDLHQAPSAPVHPADKALGTPSQSVPKPTLGTPSHTKSSLAQSVPSPVESGLELGVPSHTSTQLASLSKQHYPAWKAAIQAGEITPAKAATQKFIWQVSKQGTPNQQVLSATQTAQLWEQWQRQAVAEGVLIENPKYRVGNRQARYKLAA